VPPHAKILYVEDDEADADLARWTLERHAPGWHLDVARTLGEARERIGAGDPWHAIVCDLALPDGNGLDLVASLRRIGRPTPVLVLTGGGDEDSAVAAFRAGADDYLAKRPGYLEALGPRLASLLDPARPGRATTHPVRVLYAEDSAADADLLRRHAALYAPHVRIEVVPDCEAALARLDGPGCEDLDVLLVDHDLPGRCGIELLREARRLRPALPVVLVTGRGSEEVAAAALGLGASDYLAKQPGYLRLLVKALENAHHRSALDRERHALAESEARFRHMAASISEVFWIVSPGNDRVHFVSPAFEAVWGIPADAVTADPSLWWNAILPEDHDVVRERMAALAAGESRDTQYRIRRPDGGVRWIRDRGHPQVDAAGRLQFITGVAMDVTESRESRDHISRYVERLERAMLHTVEAVSAMGELRDPYTAGHQRRVGELAAAIGEAMGLPAPDVKGLRIAGYLHDIGKVSIPAEFLTKPKRLTPTEFALVKSHARSGFEIIKNVDFPWPVALTVLQHHERLDGSGYPDGIAGEAIILPARIMAVADTVEAMASDRPYRAGLGIEAALAEVESQAGRLFDAQVVAACLALFRDKGYRIPD
jgi:PAS domain S-box-containing protein/putative nucleotidyltransferase with HDIG domain